MGAIMSLKKAAAPPAPVAAPDAYMGRLDKVSSPSVAGKTWVELQEDRDGPLFLCLRPSEAKALAPALIHPAFGHFLDWAAHEKLDVDSTEAALKLIDTMSRSYDNTASTATSVSGKARGK